MLIYERRSPNEHSSSSFVLSSIILLAHALTSTLEMPHFTSLFKEALRAEWLATAGTDAALRVEVPASGNDVPAGDGLLAHGAARHVLGVALGAKRHAVVVLEELGEGEQTLTAPVALEALLVEPLAEGHDCIALVGDVAMAECANKASGLRGVVDNLHSVADAGNSVARSKRLVHRANRGRPRCRRPRSRCSSPRGGCGSPRGVTRRGGRRSFFAQGRGHHSTAAVAEPIGRLTEGSTLWTIWHLRS